MSTFASVAELTEQPPHSLDFVWLELTNKCNLQCVHCYAESGPTAGKTDVLKEDDYLDLIAQVYQLGCRRVQFIGGEPTLNRSLPKLIEAAYNEGFEFIEVFTNLTRLSDDLLNVFQQFRVAIATSFYSHDPSLHDAITNQQGSFQHTTQNIRKILDAGLTFRAAIIEMDQNRDGMAETWRFLEAMGVQNIGTDRLRAIGRASDGDCSELAELCGNCAGNILSIGPDGVVSPCIMSKQWSVGSVLNSSLDSLIQSEELSQMRRQIAEATTNTIKAQCNPCAPHVQHCTPNCSPSASCSPCAPHGGHKCLPNLWCRPGK